MKPSIAFLKVKSTQEKLDALQRVITQLFYRGTACLVWVPNEKSATFLDGWLWSCEAEGFLPHGDLKSETPPPIAITTRSDVTDAYPALINLCPQAHPNWQDFQFIYELEDLTAPEKRQATLAKQRFYRPG